VLASAELVALLENAAAPAQPASSSIEDLGFVDWGALATSTD
jgi:hypothetical protein